MECPICNRKYVRSGKLAVHLCIKHNFSKMKAKEMVGYVKEATDEYSPTLRKIGEENIKGMLSVWEVMGWI
jgi:hypothetical protein